MKIKKLIFLHFFLVLVFPEITWAMVPLEEIILGASSQDQKLDPLEFIFKRLDKSQTDEVAKLRSLNFKNNQAIYLKNSCQFYKGISFSTYWDEKQAQRSIVSTLQVIGLELTTRAIGRLAVDLKIEKTDFDTLVSNIVGNYCSQNISVISIKSLEKKLLNSFENPDPEILASIKNSPYATKYFKENTEGNEYLKRQLHYAIIGFRNFCSWGSDTEDYRMLGPYLKHPVIMSYVFNHLLGLKERFDIRNDKIVLEDSKDSIQVICKELICRKVDRDHFKLKFPLSLGSTGLKTDLEKHYCFHFKQQDISRNENKLINEWIKNYEIEDTVLETSFFISLFSGIPEPLLGLGKYSDIPFLIKSSIDEKWDKWAQEMLSLFSKDLLLEESLKLKISPIRSENFLSYKNLSVRLSLNLGELDNILHFKDKFKIYFSLKIPKNYITQLMNKWGRTLRNLDFEEQRLLKKDFATYLSYQLDLKEKLFIQKIWNKEISKILADELLSQAIELSDNADKSYTSEILEVPVEVHYGLFALNYLNQRANINASKLNFK